MNLEEFKEKVDANYNHIPNSHIYEPKDIEVLITLAEPSMGARASCDIAGIFMGFDWENNQLRIEPKEKLIRYGNSRDDVKPAILKPFEGKNYYHCSCCSYRVGKEDRFCKTCGQKLRNN